MAVAATLEAEPMEAAAARAAVGLAEARSLWRKCHERRRSPDRAMRRAPVAPRLQEASSQRCPLRGDAAPPRWQRPAPSRHMLPPGSERSGARTRNPSRGQQTCLAYRCMGPLAAEAAKAARKAVAGRRCRSRRTRKSRRSSHRSQRKRRHTNSPPVPVRRTYPRTWHVEAAARLAWCP